MTLNYRLTNQKIGSITVRPESPDMDLEQQAKDLVMDAHGKIGVAPEGIFTPEILSDETITRIETLENFVEQLRNALIDAQAGDADPETTELLDDVDSFMSYD